MPYPSSACAPEGSKKINSRNTIITRSRTSTFRYRSISVFAMVLSFAGMKLEALFHKK